MMTLVKNLKKYVDYAFDKKSFSLSSDEVGPSEHALQVAKRLRGDQRPPAIIIHGVMKRSGTVYTGELLKLHPDLAYYPNKIWEVPFLPLTGDIASLQEKFFLLYEPNRDKIGSHDFLPLFGSALIAYLYAFIPPGQRMLLKMPGVQYLQSFFQVFPYENMLLVVRDGRDVVASTMRKWPQLRFTHVCQRWNRSARMILEFDKRYKEYPGYMFAMYEDILQDPASFVAEAGQAFGLDIARYPVEEIASIPVIGSSFLKESWQDRPRGFKPIARWKEWSRLQKEIFKRIAGQTLIELGYCTSLDW